MVAVAGKGCFFATVDEVRAAVVGRYVAWFLVMNGDPYRYHAEETIPFDSPFVKGGNDGNRSKLFSSSRGLADFFDMPMIRPAASAKDADLFSVASDFGQLAAQLGWIPLVELIGLIELGVALARRIGSEPPDSFKP